MSKSFSAADHLPKNRPEDRPNDPQDLPRQRRGVTPQLHGRYPDYDVMAHADHWDEATRRVVARRVASPPTFRFFTPTEIDTLTAFCDTLLAQDAEPRIPVLRYIDERMAEGRFDGFQYVDMPSDEQTWRLLARGLDEAAASLGHESFAECTSEQRLAVCGAFAAGELSGGVWSELPVKRAWKVATRYALSAFYAHPWAWNEIGFAGPAYPQGYSRLGPDQREGWESAEAFELGVGGLQSDVRERGLE
ncbi:MAG TPA: gluconate 2-dehydrogenase subunit 3 family protein [Solirubrobacteraceae bacterium]